ncbi:hypothetical protein L6164_027924 [Bauhinia variegata]|nr:hypothetical protein L6164_027924 [Bauhinia variegata]
MAYAPFQVSEKRWTELFKENEERISHENLEHLLDALGNCGVVSEVTVSNLSRSLHFLCGSGTSRNISSNITFGRVRGQNEGFDDRRSAIMPNNPGEMMDEGAEFGKGFLFQSNNVESDIFPVNYDYDNGGYDTMMSVCGSPNNHRQRDSRTTLWTTTQELSDADDLVPDESPSSLDKELWDLLDGISEEVDEEALGRKGGRRMRVT